MSVSEVVALKNENQRLKEQNKKLIDMISMLKQMKDMFAIMDHTFNDISYKIDEIVRQNAQNTMITPNDPTDIDISFDTQLPVLVKQENRDDDHTIIVQITNAVDNHNNNNSEDNSGINGNNNNEVNGNTVSMVVNDSLRLPSTLPFINIFEPNTADNHTELALVVNSNQTDQNVSTGKRKVRRKPRCMSKSWKLRSALQSPLGSNGGFKNVYKTVTNQQSDSKCYKPYVCHWGECQYNTAIKAHFKVHLRTHTGEKPYHCDYKKCYYTAASSSQISRHRKIHFRSEIDNLNASDVNNADNNSDVNTADVDTSEV